MRKKVLHIITGLGDGGAEGVLTRLCLGSRNANNVVVSMMDEGKYGPVLRSAGITVHTLGMKQGKFGFPSFWTLIRILRAEKPDVVQTWMYHADLIGGVAARLVGVKRVFWGVRHSTLDPEHSKKSTILIAKACAYLSKLIPDQIICCASKAAEVHEQIGYDRDKLKVIHNGIDLNRFYPNEDAAQAVREKFGVDRTAFLIGMVGRANPQKNHESLLRALNLLRNDFDNFQCLLVGSNISEENESLVGLIKELNLGEHIVLAGPRSDVDRVMCALDLHVLSSCFGEGFPNVVAEAMACETVSVATKVGDSEIIVGNHDLCCEAADTSALHALLLEMAKLWSTEPSAWREIGIAGRERIERRFSVGTMIANFESAWLEYFN